MLYRQIFELVWPLPTRKPSWRKGYARQRRHFKMAVRRHLGFYRTGNSAIWSADPRKPLPRIKHGVDRMHRLRDIRLWTKTVSWNWGSGSLRRPQIYATRDLWWRKTRMMGLSDSERISMIAYTFSRFDTIQYTRVTDGQTDGRTELAWHRGIRAIAYMLSRVKRRESVKEPWGLDQQSRYNYKLGSKLKQTASAAA